MKKSTFLIRKVCRRHNACAFTVEIAKDHYALGGYKQDINLLFDDNNYLAACLDLPEVVFPKQIIIHNYLPEIHIDVYCHPSVIHRRTTVYFNIEREERRI